MFNLTDTPEEVALIQKYKDRQHIALGLESVIAGLVSEGGRKLVNDLGNAYCDQDAALEDVIEYRLFCLAPHMRDGIRLCFRADDIDDARAKFQAGGGQKVGALLDELDASVKRMGEILDRPAHPITPKENPMPYKRHSSEDTYDRIEAMLPPEGRKLLGQYSDQRNIEEIEYSDIFKARLLKLLPHLSPIIELVFNPEGNMLNPVWPDETETAAPPSGTRATVAGLAAQLAQAATSLDRLLAADQDAASA